MSGLQIIPMNRCLPLLSARDLLPSDLSSRAWPGNFFSSLSLFPKLKRWRFPPHGFSRPSFSDWDARPGGAPISLCACFSLFPLACPVGRHRYLLVTSRCALPLHPDPPPSVSFFRCSPVSASSFTTFRIRPCRRTQRRTFCVVSAQVRISLL